MKTEILSTKTGKSRVLKQCINCMNPNIIYVLKCKIDNKQYLGHWSRNWSKDKYFVYCIQKPSKIVRKWDVEKINVCINGYINGKLETAKQIFDKLACRDGHVFYNDHNNGRKTKENLPISKHLKVLIRYLTLTSERPTEIKAFLDKQGTQFKDLRDFFDITFVDRYTEEAFKKWKDWLQPEITDDQMIGSNRQTQNNRNSDNNSQGPVQSSQGLYDVSSV